MRRRPVTWAARRPEVRPWPLSSGALGSDRDQPEFRSRLAGQQFANHTTNDVFDFSPVSDASKALATLKAKFALAGQQVREGNNDDFIVARWALSRHCADQAALREFAGVLGGQV